MTKADEVGAMLAAEIPKTQTLDELRDLLRRGLLMLKGDEHAAMVVEELRESATVLGRSEGVS